MNAVPISGLQTLLTTVDHCGRHACAGLAQMDAIGGMDDDDDEDEDFNEGGGSDDDNGEDDESDLSGMSDVDDEVSGLPGLNCIGIRFLSSQPAFPRAARLLFLQAQ